MKLIIYAIIICISVAVSGCSGTEDSALLEINAIIDDEPELAYVKLKNINSHDLSNKSSKALYALLYTQAEYKNMVILKSDSLIDVALNYYESRDDKEKYVRSMIYKGAALADMGDREDAILWYKQAVEVADSTDYLNLGQANLRMAELYRDSYIKNNKYFYNYRKALEYYKKAGNTRFEQKCLRALGLAYRNSRIKTDSAYYFLKASIELSLNNNDTAAYFSSYQSLSRTYWYDTIYQKSKETALYVIKHGDKYMNTSMSYHDLSRIYARLGIIDSAYYYFNYVSNLNSDSRENSVTDLLTLTEIEIAKKNYKKAFQYKLVSSDLASGIVNSAASNEIYRIEKRFDKKALELENMDMHRRNSLYGLIISAALLIIFILVAIIIRRKNRERENEALIEQLRLQTIESEKQLIEDLGSRSVSDNYSNSVENLKQAFGNQISTIKHLIDYSYQHNSNPESFMKEFNRVIKINKLSEGMWRDLQCYVDENSNNVIKDIKEKFSQLSAQEINFISLMCCRFSNIEIMLCMGYSNERSVCNKRIIISKKMGIDMPLEKYLNEYTNCALRKRDNMEN